MGFSDDRIRRLAAALGGLLVLGLAWGAPPSLSAQGLPLKRTVPGTTPYTCPPSGTVATPAQDARDQAAELASSASQALVLGDLNRARGFLDRAVQLDSASVDLAYRHARVLDQLGDSTAAVPEYCRTLALKARGQTEADARARLTALVSSNQPTPPQSAVTAFQNALDQADAGSLRAAVAQFDAAVTEAPDWADAVYDRGVVYARQGDDEAAVKDLLRYVELSPDADDAATVARYAGQLEGLAVAANPSPAGGLILGLIVPGTGQLYGGRFGPAVTLGFGVGAIVATGFLIRRTTKTCKEPLATDGSCPGNSYNWGRESPYRWVGVGVGAAITLAGAIEAYLDLRDQRRARAAVGVTMAAVKAVQVSPSGEGVDVSLLRLTF